MVSRLSEIFNDQRLIEKIRDKLPHLFTIADLECSRSRTAGMEVGSTREKILISLIIYKFGQENIEVGAITQKEVDVKVFGYPVSIKTITEKSYYGTRGVKASWTVDAKKSAEFCDNYAPTCDILLVQVKWDIKQPKIRNNNSFLSRMQKDIHLGGLFLIPLEVQRKILKELGNSQYLKLPKPGTNPRGIEIQNDAMFMLLQDSGTSYIPITWKKMQIDYDPYKRWAKYWEE